MLDLERLLHISPVIDLDKGYGTDRRLVCWDCLQQVPARGKLIAIRPSDCPRMSTSVKASQVALSLACFF